MNCPAGTKTTIAYTSKSGVKSRFITHDSPVTIECLDKPGTGKFIFTLNDYGYTADCGSSGQLFSDQIIADSYNVEGTTNPGTFGHCSWSQITFYIDTSIVFSEKKTSRYSVSSVPNPNYSKGEKFLVIKDAQGNKIFQIEVLDCGHEISCGDECPAGYHKCIHDKYPGYCCIPCASTASKLKNLASKMGKKK